MEYARLLLQPHDIVRPAHDGAKVHLLDGRIGQGGGLLRVQSIAALRHVKRLRGVVEAPLEGLGCRVRVHLAQHVGRLVAAHTVNSLLLWLANGFV